MARARGTKWNDPDKFIEICAKEAEKAIRFAFADFTRKATAFRKKWGTEGMDINFVRRQLLLLLQTKDRHDDNVLHV